jgi:hypothetical protein
MDYGRASALKLLGGLPTSREVLRPSEPHLSLSLSLNSTKNELGSTIGSQISLSDLYLAEGGMGGIYRWSE